MENGIRNGAQLPTIIPQLTLPGHESRQKTDSIWIFAIVFIFSSWVYGNIYASPSTEDLDLVFNSFGEHTHNIMDNYFLYFLMEMRNYIWRLKFFVTAYFLYRPLTVSIPGCWLALCFSINFFSLLRYKSQFCTFAGTMCIPFVMAGLGIAVYTRSIENFSELAVEDIIFRIAIPMMQECFWIIFCCVALFCIAKVGIIPVANVLDKTLRFLCTYLFLILFGLIVIILQVSVIILSLASLMNLRSDYILFYIVSMRGVFIFNFISLFGKMTIAHMVATWHKADDGTKMLKPSILQSLKTVAKYHVGSIALGATYIVPTVVALIAVFRFKRTKTQSIFKCFVSIVLIIFLIPEITDYSLMATGAYGTNFYNSTKRVLKSLTDDSLLSVAFLCVFYVTLSVGIFFLILLVAAPSVIWDSETVISDFGTDINMLSVINFVFAAMLAIATMMSPLFIVLKSVGLTSLIFMSDLHEMREISSSHCHGVFLSIPAP